MLALAATILAAIIGVGLKFLLPRMFVSKDPAQAAVDKETQMAKDAVDAPTQSDTEKELSNGSF